MEQTSNLKLPLINVNNAEDLKKTFIDYVKMISGVDDSSALQILDRVITTLQTTKQDKLTAGENITIVDNVISGQGGVEESDVMDIIENNAEQTNTLDVGTSATFDATSDEQIPTSKAVSDLMASAGGGSKLYLHNIKFTSKINETTIFNYVDIVSDNPDKYTTNTLKNYLLNVIGGYGDTHLYSTFIIDNEIYVFKSYRYQIGLKIYGNKYTLSIVDNSVQFTKTDFETMITGITDKVISL